jgi:hypothetical protein
MCVPGLMNGQEASSRPLFLRNDKQLKSREEHLSWTCVVATSLPSGCATTSPYVQRKRLKDTSWRTAKAERHAAALDVAFGEDVHARVIGVLPQLRFIAEPLRRWG